MLNTREMEARGSNGREECVGEGLRMAWKEPRLVVLEGDGGGEGVGGAQVGMKSCC